MKEVHQQHNYSSICNVCTVTVVVLCNNIIKRRNFFRITSIAQKKDSHYNSHPPGVVYETMFLRLSSFFRSFHSFVPVRLHSSSFVACRTCWLHRRSARTARTACCCRGVDGVREGDLVGIPDMHAMSVRDDWRGYIYIMRRYCSLLKKAERIQRPRSYLLPVVILPRMIYDTQTEYATRRHYYYRRTCLYLYMYTINTRFPTIGVCTL